jgi:hypothetical protein
VFRVCLGQGLGEVAEAVQDGGDLVGGRCGRCLVLAGWLLASAGGCPVALLLRFGDPSGDQAGVGAGVEGSPVAGDARSLTCTGQRTSSVNRTPAVAPEVSECTYVSCVDSPSPMMSEVRAMTVAGSRPLIAVSAAALAAPYGVMGSGKQVSS